MHHHDCTGCGVCLLVCPVWRERRDLRLTPKGRARALQHGATRAELAASIAGCTLCGACEPACPEELPLVDMVMALRREADLPAGADDFSARKDKSYLLAGQALRANAALLKSSLQCFPGHDLAADDGDDIAAALESGAVLDAARLEAFLASLAQARRLVVGNALLLRFLRRWLPGITAMGLGEALLPATRSKIAPRDLYVIDARAYNLDQARLVGHYDALRAMSGCHMNLDLQRIAVPAAGQGDWILEGRDVERIVVEDAADRDAFAASGRPVVHVLELV